MLLPSGHGVQLAPVVGIVDPVTQVVHVGSFVAPLGQGGNTHAARDVEAAGEIFGEGHAVPLIEPSKQ